MHPQKKNEHYVLVKNELHKIINWKRPLLLHAVIWVLKSEIYVYIIIYIFVRTYIFIAFIKHFWKLHKVDNIVSFRKGELGGRGSGVGWILLFHRCFPHQQHHSDKCISLFHRQHSFVCLNYGSQKYVSPANLISYRSSILYNKKSVSKSHICKCSLKFICTWPFPTKPVKHYLQFQG